MRAHLEAIQRRTRKPHDALRNGPKLPHGCEGLWATFLDLHNSRGSTGFGPAPIRFVDFHAYESVSGIKLAQWELRAIRKADNAYLRREAERARE